MIGEQLNSKLATEQTGMAEHVSSKLRLNFNALFLVLPRLRRRRFEYYQDFAGLSGYLAFQTRNRFASIKFIDAPVGTGFSYINTSQVYTSSDTKSTWDYYMFFRKFENHVTSYVWANDPFVQEALYVRKGTIKDDWKRCNYSLYCMKKM